MASPLTPTSAPAGNTFAGLPTEIIMLIVDQLDPEEIYSLFFVEPRFSSVESPSGRRVVPRHQRIREICISHNVKFDEMSTLTLAIQNRDVTTVRQVLREVTAVANASPDKPKVTLYASRFRWHVWLLAAVQRNSMDITQLLFQIDEMRDYLDEDRYIDDLLIEATAEHGSASMLTFLIDNGANPHSADLQGFTPLLLAANVNNLAAVTLLVTQYHADCTVRDLYRSSALHYAAQNSNFPMARLLLQHGAETDIEDMAGYSPLSMAAEQGDAEIVKLLLHYGADPNFVEFGLLGPLGFSARNGHEEVTRILVQTTQADVNHQGLLGYTPLMEAVSNMHLGTAQEIMKSPALNPNERNALNETAIHVALYSDPTLETAELLLSLPGLWVDARDDSDITPLMMALAYLATSEDKERVLSLIRRLVATGEVDVNAANYEGMSVLELAVRTKCTEAVQLLLNTGEIVVTPEQITLASALGYWEIYDLILDAAGPRFW